MTVAFSIKPDFAYYLLVVSRSAPPPHGATTPRQPDFTITDTPHSVRFLWTSDRPHAETSYLTTHNTTADKHPCPWRNSDPQSHWASGRRPTPWTARPLESAHSHLTTWKS